MTSLLLQGLVLGLSSAASPGPFQAVLLAQSLRVGAARAAPLAAVPLVSDPVVIATTLLALAQLPPGFLLALRLAGAALLLWIAFATLRAALRPPDAPQALAPGAPAAGGAPGPRAAPRGFWRAVLVNATNPNAWMFWSAVGGPLVVAAWRDRPAGALAFLAAFYTCLTAGNAALVLFAGGAARLGPRLARALAAGSGLALLGFGLWQLARAAGA